MTPRFEAFVARLYVDEGLRHRFLADARSVATRAGLSPNEILAAERIDRTGLELAAASFAHKRRSTAYRFRNRWLPLQAWALGLVVLFSPPQSGLPRSGQWQRLSSAPIIAPRGDGWESAGTFNPAVIEHEGRIVMLYRAQGRNGTSRLGYASSTDGITFVRREAPVLSPEADYERDGGVEDPRLVRLGDTYYLTYTGYNKKDAQLCLATSKDLVHWERKGVILPANKGRWNVGWTKAGAIVPQKIDGKFWMYFLGTAADKTDQMGIAYSNDLLHWTEPLDAPVLPRRTGRFDSRVVEPGPPPSVTDREIVLVYNGADDTLVYRTGIVRFDRHDPRRVLSRTDAPVFAPETDWEKTGQVPNVVFVEGMVRRGGRYLFYYGGADKHVGVATGGI